jgi:hypothetical protein
MTTSLLGVTTFWLFLVALTFEMLAFGCFIGSFLFGSLCLVPYIPLCFVSLWERCPSSRVPIMLDSVVIYLVTFKGFCVLYFSRVHYYSVLGGVYVKCGVHPSTPFPDLAVSVIYVPHPHHDCLKVSLTSYASVRRQF